MIKFYSVAKGKEGQKIYNSWEECKKNIQIEKPIYKSFYNYEEAKLFLNNYNKERKERNKIEIKIKQINILEEKKRNQEKKNKNKSSYNQQIIANDIRNYIEKINTCVTKEKLNEKLNEKLDEQLNKLLNEKLNEELSEKINKELNQKLNKESNQLNQKELNQELNQLNQELYESEEEEELPPHIIKKNKKRNIEDITIQNTSNKKIKLHLETNEIQINNKKYINIFIDTILFKKDNDNTCIGLGIYFGKKDNRNISKICFGAKSINRAMLKGIVESIEIINKKKIGISMTDNIMININSFYCIKGIHKLFNIQANQDLFDNINKLTKERKGITKFRLIPKYMIEKLDKYKTGYYYAHQLAEESLKEEIEKYNQKQKNKEERKKKELELKKKREKYKSLLKKGIILDFEELNDLNN